MPDPTSVVPLGPDKPSVVINGRFLQQPVTGVQRYAREVLSALDELPPSGLALELLAPAGTVLPPLRHIRARCVGRLQGHAWEQVELPWHARGRLLWGLTSTGPLCTLRQSITVHDAAVRRMPGTYSRAFRWWYRLLLARLGPRLPLVMTVSHFSGAEAQACFDVPPQRLRVSHEGWQHLLREQEAAAASDVVARHGLAGQPFVLAVSSPTPNKNFRCIVEALAQMGAAAPRCVVVGSAAAGVFRGEAPPSALMHIGRVSDAELLALYRQAAAFVFPSFYEGFGLPPLEALSQGCPVLASNAAAVREVCADAALYFAAERPDELAAQLTRLLADPPLQRRLGTAGRLRAGAFSWQSAARAHLDAMQERADPRAAAARRQAGNLQGEPT